MTPSDQTDTVKSAPNPWLKLAIELGPLLIFFLANGLGGIFWATGSFMVATGVSIFLSWHLTGHVPRMLWVTGAIVLVLGGITLYLNDERFIKIKPTIVNLLFAGILFVGLARGKHYLKFVFEAALPPMSERGWTIVTRNWSLFFLAMAIFNELVWRNFSTDAWVAFKTFVYLPMFLAYAVFQAFVMQRHETPARDQALGDPDKSEIQNPD